MSGSTAHERRIEALRAALAGEGLAGALLSRPQHLFYFTGATAGAAPAFLLVLPQSLVAVAPAPLGACETVTYTDYDIHRGWSLVEGAERALDQALARSGLEGRPLGLELSHLPAAFMPAVARHAGAPRDIAGLLWSLRKRKDAVEVAQIEANVRANDQAFADLRAALRPGVADVELWAVMHQALCRAAGGPVILEADLGVGVRSDNPDAKPCGARLAAGDTVFADLYSASHGYYADTTRVFTLGEPSARQRELHAILAEALAAGEAQLGPGVAANAVDAAVRGVIERAGYGPQFPHHSGHAYGIFQQERPYLIPAEAMPLEEGMIVTLEPGIYIPGWGGMRLEGNYLITAGGMRTLDQFPRRLAAC